MVWEGRRKPFSRNANVAERRDIRMICGRIGQTAPSRRRSCYLERFCKKLEKFSRHSRPYISHRRQLLGTRYETIDDYSVAKKRLDVGFVDASYPKRGSRDEKHPWPQMLVPGVLKCNPLTDGVAEAWHDLAVRAGKMLLAQATRRFVVGFTICGTLMSVWVYDRLGGIASP